MRVVHLSTSDLLGGAGRAAYRLHRALCHAGVDSRFLVSEKIGDDPSVREAFPLRFSTLRRRWRERLDAWPLRAYPNRPAALFSPAWRRNSIWREVNAAQPDVVHLHWVGRGFLSIPDVPRLRGRLVWTLHDAWPYTGGCHYPGRCDRFRSACGQCPVLGSNQAGDLSRRTLARKQQHWTGVPLQFIALNRASAAQLQGSALFRGAPATVIPPAVDVGTFHPTPRVEARRMLGLDPDALVLALGALTGADPRKGFDLATTALASLPPLGPAPAILCCFGTFPPTQPVRYGAFLTHHVGRVHDDITLSLIYSAADALLVPSREDTGPLVTVEALACGTPVIGFAVGTTAERVEHQRNGYLAASVDAASLAQGVQWIAEHRHDESLRVAARETALRDASLAAQVPTYLELYRRVQAGASAPVA